MLAAAGFKHLRATALGLLCALPMLLATTRAGADIVLIAIASLFALHSLKERDFAWLTAPEMKVLAALWLYLMASAWLISSNRLESFSMAFAWGRFVLFFAAARFWLLTSPRALKINGLFVCGTLALVALDTLWQYKTGTSFSGRPIIAGRLTGPLSTRNIGNWTAKIGFPVIGMLAWLAVACGQRRWLWPLGGFSLALLTLVLVSGERSSALLTLLGVGATGLAFFIHRPALRKYVALCGAGISVLLALLLLTQQVVQARSQQLVAQISDFWDTPYGQLYIAAVKLWQEHPLMGIGAYQFRRMCWPNMEPMGVTYCDIHPHNLYLEWLTESGLIGFCLFAIAMTIMLMRFLRTSSFQGTALIPTAFSCGALTVLLFPPMVTQSFFSNWPGVLFWYSLSVALSAPRIAGRVETHV